MRTMLRLTPGLILSLTMMFAGIGSASAGFAMVSRRAVPFEVQQMLHRGDHAGALRLITEAEQACVVERNAVRAAQDAARAGGSPPAVRRVIVCDAVSMARVETLIALRRHSEAVAVADAAMTRTWTTDDAAQLQRGKATALIAAGRRAEAARFLETATREMPIVGAPRALLAAMRAQLMIEDTRELPRARSLLRVAMRETLNVAHYDREDAGRGLLKAQQPVFTGNVRVAWALAARHVAARRSQDLFHRDIETSGL